MTHSHSPYQYATIVSSSADNDIISLTSSSSPKSRDKGADDWLAVAALASTTRQQWTRKNLFVSVLAVLGTIVLLAAMASLTGGETPSPKSFMPSSYFGSSSSSSEDDSDSDSDSDSDVPVYVEIDGIPIPSGVNIGSWLSLEDYFYVGPTGAVEVATPDANQAAICLPPLYTGQPGSPTAWSSETDLLASLIETAGLAHALKVFQAHRTSFITESDIAQLAAWGVQHVRIPLSWCFTDANPADIDATNTSQAYYEELLEQFTCPDPFYQDQLVRWPAIPRSFLTQFLRHCANYGVTASLDLHTYPGATSPGTFSGMWPRPPRFWQHDQPENPQGDLGRQLLRDFVSWVEDLATEDPVAFDGIMGISPMNEPAHLSGVFRGTKRDYLPPLPAPMAAAYLKENMNRDADVPDGPHLRVMKWLQDATDVFRESSLPQAGKQLHVNVHESFLSPQVVSDPEDDEEENGNKPYATDVIAAWWSQITSHTERTSWAVLDMHHYHAWSSTCTGTSDGPPMGNYTCSDVEARDETLTRCARWAPDFFRKAVDDHCGPGAMLMSGEFSTSTHHKVRHACNDLDTLKASYKTQMDAAHEANVKMYYWSFRMPFGGAFRSAWSFSHLMYRFGVNPHPDESNFPCGDHGPHHANQVTDDFFNWGG